MDTTIFPAAQPPNCAFTSNQTRSINLDLLDLWESARQILELIDPAPRSAAEAAEFRLRLLSPRDHVAATLTRIVEVLGDHVAWLGPAGQRLVLQCGPESWPGALAPSRELAERYAADFWTGHLPLSEYGQVVSVAQTVAMVAIETVKFLLRADGKTVDAFVDPGDLAEIGELLTIQGLKSDIVTAPASPGPASVSWR